MRTILYILLLNFPNVCFAQSGAYDLKFKTLTTAQGLPDNVVIKTVKDKHGFLWIATHNGISRFDGKNFQHYTYVPGDSNSLRSIWVSDLLLDNQKVLWATTEWGICYYDEREDHFTYINKPSEVQLVFKIPMYVDTGSTIWIAAEDGLKKVNTVGKTFSSVSLKRIADPQFIIKQSNRFLIIGTRGKGLYKYDIARDQYKLLTIPMLPSGTHFMNAIERNGRLLICCDEGILQLSEDESCALFNSGSGQLQGQKIDQLMCVRAFPKAFGNSILVCGTYNKKLVVFDEVSKTFVGQFSFSGTNPDKFFPAVVYDIAEEDDILWISTDRGLSQLNLHNQQPKTFLVDDLKKDGSNDFVKKAIADKDEKANTVWMSLLAPAAGMLLYDVKKEMIVGEWNTRRKGTPRTYNSLESSRFTNTIYGLRDNSIDLFNTSKGLFKTVAISGTAYCAEEDKTGNLWIGTDVGITRINIQTGISEKYICGYRGSDVEQNTFGSAFPVYSLRQAADGNFWLANPKYGLFSFDVRTRKFTPHRQEVNLAFSTLNRCNSLEIVGADSIWIGNMSGISCYIISQNKFINYNASNGLKSDYVYSVCKDSLGNLWGRGNRDLFYFNTKKYSFISTALQSPFDAMGYMQRISLSGNDVLLGHDAGFSVFNSPSFTDPGSSRPSLQFTACRINGSSIFFNKDSSGISPIELAHTQNQVGIEFTAIEYNNPNEIEYWYQLSGIEKNWTNAGAKRSADYLNLPPGKYVFSAYAVNKRNHTKSETRQFKFTIHAALWQRWWFWPMLALLFSAIIFLAAAKRIKNIRENEKQKTAVNKMMAELETKMLRSQMNPHFIFNSLNSIQKYIWENKEEDAAEYLSSFAKLMRAILENSRRETVTVKEEMNVMKLYIELEHRRSNAGFDYHIKTDEALLTPAALIPPMIMQPFIENAIWHGLNKKKTKGNLDINVFKRGNELVCIIDDDGVGIPAASASPAVGGKSLGITITRQRIEKIIETTGHNAGVEIINKNKDSGGATGTIVTIVLPLQTSPDA